MSATNEIAPAARLCPNCGAAQPLAPGDRVWPPDWACAACGESPPAPEGIPLLRPNLADTLTGFDPSGFATVAEAETRDFIYIDDLTRAIERASTVHGIGGEVFQIATARETTVGEFAEALSTALAAGDPGESFRTFLWVRPHSNDP